jgi:hypothetical protein
VAELRRERLAFARPHCPALGTGLGHHRFHLVPRDLARAIGAEGENFWLPRYQLDRHFSTQPQGRLHFPKTRGYHPGTVQVNGEPGPGVEVFGPAGLHGQVPTIEVSPQSLAKLALKEGKVAGKLG